MQLWALIVDGFRESLDRKIFWVLIILTVLVTLVMASVGFEGEDVSLVFGMWSAKTDRFNPISQFGRANLVGFAVYFLASSMMGGIGITLMVIATAGAFPAFMDRGAVGVMFSKPIGRPRLFLYKYLAGMVFVVVQATLFFVLTFLVMGMCWGVWVPGYLMSIPLLVLLFSYVYCVSVLVAIKTGSPVAAILISLFCWMLFAMVHQAPAAFEAFPTLKEQRMLYTAVRVVSWIPPKTGDFPYLAARWAQAGTSIDAIPFFSQAEIKADESAEVDRAREFEEKELTKNQIYSVGSSLLFEVVVVLWAMRVFARKDY
jgi:ABC-type transport system involved in multi-copper enzyme maturation permease subunit